MPFPRLFARSPKADRTVERASQSDTGFGATLDDTPATRYDTWTELGPQEANVASPYIPVGPAGIPEGATGNVPSTIGCDPSDNPKIGLKPASQAFVDLRNGGVFAPVFADGSISLVPAWYWYDGGAMEPMWQQPMNVSPQPEPWDQGLVIGYGQPLKVLQGG